ncbi:MAG: 3-phosphoshikimate 1-carboxyvinyltransferase [Bacillota bacterium]
MKIIINPSELTGNVHIIASKSLSHRYLIGAALSTKPSRILNVMESNDIDATREALRCLGATINQSRVFGGVPTVKCAVINAHESGSTLRFLIPLAMCQSVPVRFTGEGRLPKRSLEVYETMFHQRDVTYNTLSTDNLPVQVAGPLTAGEFHIKGDVSSQFISGMLFALPLLNNASDLIIEPPYESKSYVDLTIETLKAFKIKIMPTKQGYHIPGNQTYHPVNTVIEGDYSQAAFFIVAALLNNNPLSIANLNPNSIQGDREILTIIKRMNGHYTFDHHDVLTVFPSSTMGTTIDLANIPDLGPILMVLAAVSKGQTTFTNIRRLRLKESDRVGAMSSILTQWDVPHTIDDNIMTIQGIESLSGNQTFDSFNDHRIVMALVIASLKADGPITITNAQAINKSYPQFLDIFRELKGNITFPKEVRQ